MAISCRITVTPFLNSAADGVVAVTGIAFPESLKPVAVAKTNAKTVLKQIRNIKILLCLWFVIRLRPNPKPQPPNPNFNLLPDR
jgi:hypothetical protein